MGARYVPVILTADTDRAREAVEKFVHTFDDIEGESERAAKGASGHFTSHLGAEFFGGLARDAFGAFTNEAERFILDSVRFATDLQQQVANVATIKPEIDTSQVYRELREMQTRIPQTAEQLSESLYDTFSSINVTQAEGLELVEKFAKGATAAVTDAKTFGTAVVGVINAYGEEVERVDHIQDVFFNTVKNGVVTGAELATNLGVATQAAKNAGVNFDELGALISGVTKEGGPAAQNINNLANTLQKLPTKETQEALHDLKVETIDLRTGGFRPILDILSDLKGKLDKLPPAIRAAKLQEIFPDAQARTGLQTLLSQLGFVQEALRQNREEAGAFGNAYQTMAQTNAVASALQENAIRNLQQKIGETIIQNAAWVKSTEIVTKQINGQTAALDEAGSQTEIFANDVGLAFSKIKAQAIPFFGFFFQFVRGVTNLVGAAGSVIVGFVLRLVEEVGLGLNRIVVSVLNTIISLINNVEALVEKAGLKGVIGVGGQIAPFKDPGRPNFGSDIFFKEYWNAVERMNESAKSMHGLAVEGRKAREEIDRAVEEQRRVREARDARRQQEDEAGRLGIINGGTSSQAVRDAQALADEQRNRQAGQGTSLSPDQVKSMMTEQTERRRKGQKVIDEADKWSIGELKDIQEFFKSATGRALPISAYGQSRYHNKIGLDHRNSADVALNPKSKEGKLLISYLEQNQVPHRAFNGPYRNAQGVLTATDAHIHIGEPSRAFGKNVDSRRITRSDQLASIVLGGKLGDDMKTAPEGGQLYTVTPAQIDNLLRKFRPNAQTPITTGATDDVFADTSRLSYEETASQRQVSEYYAEMRKADEDAASRRVFLAEYVEGRRREISTEYYNRETSMMLDLGGREQELSELRRQAADDQLSEQRRLLSAKDEEVDLTRRLIDLQDEYANAYANTGLREQIALQEEMNNLRREDVEAIERQARARVRLADQGTFHKAQADAELLEFLAQQKSITEIYSDARVNIVQQTFDAIDNGLDRLIPKGNIFLDTIKQIAGQLLKLAASKIFLKLFGLDDARKESSAQSAGGGGGFNVGSFLNAGGGGGGAGGGGGGFSISNLLNTGGGGGQSAGGGGGFGGIINGFRQQGFSGGLRNLFGFGGGSAASAAAGTAASTAGSAGAASAGAWTSASAASALFGGTAAAGAGAGAGAGGIGAAAGSSVAGGGGSLMGSMGALFTNPWTAVVAAAVIGGVLLWNHFRNRTEKALKKEILREYGVTVKEMSVLKEIKAIGEQAFGKGKVRSHLTETVRLDQSKELLAAYAERTGQDSSKLVTNKQYADPTFAGNQFTYREFGGPVSAGVPYIVGEKRPEVFVPSQNGTIVPSVGEYAETQGNLWSRIRAKVRAAQRAESSGGAPVQLSPRSGAAQGGSQQHGTQEGGIPPALVAALVEALNDSTETNRDLKERLRAIRPDEHAQLVAEGFARNGTARAKAQESLGLRNR